MKRSPWVRQLAVVGVFALVAAACADDDTDEPVDEPEPTEEVEEEPADEPEDEADEPEEMDEDAVGDIAEDQLNLGYILPESGPLAFLGPPQIQAVELAIADMNAAGGVLGNDVTLSSGDEAGDAGIASESAQRLLGEGVNAIIGAAASGMSLAFVDAVTSAGVLQCSASNTAPTFTNGEYSGLYFRTASTDALQGPVLAETIIGDGNTNPAIIARADDYGRGLMEATVAELEAQGASVALAETYDPEAPNFQAEVSAVVDSGADSVAIIAFDEGAQILADMVEAGLSPQEFPSYGADGMRSNELWELVDPGNPAVLEGMRGTAPSPEADPDFLSRFQEETGLDDPIFAAQAYDCTIIIGLAATAAGSAAPTAIAGEMVNVTRDGAECTDFAECLELLENGEDIAYQTKSGIQLAETDTGNGEPDSGEYEVWQIDGEGNVSTVTTVTSTF